MDVADRRRDNFSMTDVAQVHVRAKLGGSGDGGWGQRGLLDQRGKPETNDDPKRLAMIEGDRPA
jgi:hypothetical protein